MSRIAEALGYVAPYPQSAGFTEPTTSRAAAIAVTPRVAAMQARIMVVLDGKPNGLTADETADELGETQLSIRPRFTELLHLGKIERTGKRRHNVSGRAAHVFRRRQQ